MEMSNFEIARSFMEARDKKTQVGILADLNLCNQTKIREILIIEGVPYHLIPTISQRSDDVRNGDFPRKRGRPPKRQI